MTCGLVLHDWSWQWGELVGCKANWPHSGGCNGGDDQAIRILFYRVCYKFGCAFLEIVRGLQNELRLSGWHTRTLDFLWLHYRMSLAVSVLKMQAAVFCLGSNLMDRT